MNFRLKRLIEKISLLMTVCFLTTTLSAVRLTSEQISRSNDRLAKHQTVLQKLKKNPSTEKLSTLLTSKDITQQIYNFILTGSETEEFISIPLAKERVGAATHRPLDPIQQKKAYEILKGKILQEALKQLEEENFTEETLIRLLKENIITTEQFDKIWSPDGRYTGFVIAEKGKARLPGKPLPLPRETLFGPFFVPFEQNQVDVVLGVKHPGGLVGSEPKLSLINASVPPFIRTPQILHPPFLTYIDPFNLIIKWPRIDRNALRGNVDYGISYCNQINKDPQEKSYPSDRYDLIPLNPKGHELFPEPGLNDNFRFLVYGDTREEWKMGSFNPMPGKKYLQKDSVFVETIAFIEKTVQKPKPILHLHTGDFVYAGGIAEQWIEVLEKLNEVIKDKYFAAAIGNHEIYSSNMLGLDKIIPHFGNLFHSLEPKESPINHVEHIEQTQRWFDLGCIRFIHLPIPHEDVEGSVYSLLLKAIYPILKPEVFSQKEIVQPFIDNLAKASNDRKRGVIKFIIVYGHMPLVTSPRYKVPHSGLFEIERNPTKIDFNLIRAANDIEDAFLTYKPDAYFCGHNHIYDRVEWNSIPMVTIGIGTHLKGCHPLTPPSSEKEIAFQRILEKRFIAKSITDRFIGFLDCSIDLQNNTIQCSLVGKKTEGLEISPTLLPEQSPVLPKNIQLYDKFKIYTLQARQQLQQPTIKKFAPIEIRKDYATSKLSISQSHTLKGCKT